MTINSKIELTNIVTFLEHEFEKEWSGNGGHPYTKNTDRKKNGKY